MAGILRTDTIQNSNTSTIITQTNSTTITIGTSGQTVALASGASSSGFGATYNGAVNWDTTPKTTTVTAASGVGYFINTTSGGVTVNLPAATAGSIVALSDYAATWNTNNVTVNANGSEKIGGVASAPATLNTQGQSVTFIYVDSTQGWVNVGDATKVAGNSFVTATGGTITTCGDYKIHTFTGPGTFTVTSTASSPTNNVVDYLVVAGGGGGGAQFGGGGGGAGGFRISASTYPVSGAPVSPISNPISLPVSATTYPITVGSGGSSAGIGSDSIFSTITSAGGGSGGCSGPTKPGGSGGGAKEGVNGDNGGSGNTPPVSPPQGNSGGSTVPNIGTGGGGGGAIAVGQPYGSTSNGGNGAGIPSALGTNGESSGGYYYYSGGGGGARYPGGSSTGGLGGGGDAPGGGLGQNGATNTGGGGGGSERNGPGAATNGGSGIVVIRYKFQ
jgi:hypothetical protein